MDLVVGDGWPVWSAFEEEVGVSGSSLSLTSPGLAFGVLGEGECCKTLEKNNEERLRGGSIGAAGIESLACNRIPVWQRCQVAHSDLRFGVPGRWPDCEDLEDQSVEGIDLAVLSML